MLVAANTPPSPIVANKIMIASIFFGINLIVFARSAARVKRLFFKSSVARV